MSDFNINLLICATRQNNVIAQGYISHTTKPTRLTSTTANLIYHLYSNHTHTIYDSWIIVTAITVMTDHFGIFHLVYGIPPMHQAE